MKNSLLTIVLGCILLLVTCSCGSTVNGTSTTTSATPITHVSPSPAPTSLQVTRVVSPASSLPPVDKTITDANEVQQLYRMALAAPVIPEGAIMNCPVAPAQYQDVHYNLQFFHNKLMISQMTLNVLGCYTLNITSDPNDHEVNNDFITFFLKIVGRSSMLS